MSHIKRNCDNPSCKKEYQADTRALNRGWGKCCSKSCASSLREMSKPGYDPKRVAINNVRRANWNIGTNLFIAGKDENGFGVFRGNRTSEGYKMYENGNEFQAVDEFDDPMYTGTLDGGDEDPGDDEYYNGKDFN